MLKLAVVDTTWPSFFLWLMGLPERMLPGEVRPPCDVQVLLFTSA